MLADVLSVRSIGAALQNLLLAAQALGIGLPWIGDVVYAYAYEGLCAWPGEQCEMIAAVSSGYPSGQPRARPRRPVSRVVRRP
jgi:nitroreductase